MATIRVNDLDHYFEEQGSGQLLVFIHGAFVDARLWDSQFNHFAKNYRVLRYDLRGHGRTGPSDLNTYTVETFAVDLVELLDSMGIESAIICGLSLGGMIAQSFAVHNPARVKALILSDTAVSVSLTWTDKVQRYVLFPKWAMLLTIRWLSAEKFTRFSFWLARVTRSEDWFGQDETTAAYVEQCMLQMSDAEYLKIYNAIYEFKLLPLERITAPTLVLNGEYESKSVFRHTQEILRRVKGSEAVVVSGAGHTSNMENPMDFNALVGEFLRHSL
jgi:pimeloyl-ACP methyl ester carboxylesterase